MDIPLRYAGNFGEIRPNHFHTGLDIKTGGVIGKKVFAIDDGYVSRIKIQLWGYGKVIYVTHANGYTSVYAHLSSFNDEIDSFIKEYQYDQKTYTLDVYLYKNQINVKKHDLLGYSGNTGNSFAPHLHFEIRDNKTEYAINPLTVGFNFTDNIPPSISDFIVYPIDTNSYVNGVNTKLKFDLRNNIINKKYYLHDTIQCSGNFGFGISIIDRINNSPNKFAPYSIDLFVDSVNYLSVKFDKFDFNDKSYINSYIDYEEYLKNKSKIHRLFIDENNKLKNYYNSKNNGIVKFYDNKIHNIKIVVKDYNLNKAEFNCVVRSKEFYEKPIEIDTAKNYMKYFEKNAYSTHDFIVNIPKSALIKSMYFDYNVETSPKQYYSDFYTFSNENVPLFKKISIGINTQRVPKKYLNKIIIAKLNSKNRPTSYKGFIKNDYIFCETKKFGKYVIMVDTIPPVIKAINIFNGAKFINDKFIKFKIYDNLSGVYKINGFIDDKWVCFEYDPKSSLIVYKFDNRIEKNKEHNFKLEVCDFKKNKATFEAKIYH